MALSLTPLSHRRATRDFSESISLHYTALPARRGGTVRAFAGLMGTQTTGARKEKGQPFRCWPLAGGALVVSVSIHRSRPRFPAKFRSCTKPPRLVQSLVHTRWVQITWLEA